jgi:hypothetical protein
MNDLIEFHGQGGERDKKMNTRIERIRLFYYNNQKALKIIVPLLGIFILILSFRGCGAEEHVLPGGGFGLLLVTILCGYAAYRSGVKALWMLTVFMGLVWFYDKLVPVADEFGVTPEGIKTHLNILLVLIIGLGIWIWKAGSGLFFWRTIVLVFLIAAWIGGNSKTIFTGWDNFKKNAPTVSMPDIGSGSFGKMFRSVADLLDSGAIRTSVVARHQTQQNKKWTIMAGTIIHDCSSGSSCVPTALTYGTDVVGISLGEAVEINGIIYEKFSLPDRSGKPGQRIGWVNTDSIISVSTAPPPPPATGATASTLPVNWKLVAVVPRSTNGFANIIVDGNGNPAPLLPGLYRQNPLGKTGFLFPNESQPIGLGDGENFTVPSGEMVVGIKTDHPAVEIYRKD